MGIQTTHIDVSEGHRKPTAVGLLKRNVVAGGESPKVDPNHQPQQCNVAVISLSGWVAFGSQLASLKS